MNKVLLLLALSGAVLASCNQNAKRDEVRAETELTTKKDSVAEEVVLMSMPESVQATAVPDSLLLEMSNNTKEKIMTGEYYDIEKLHDKTWMTVMPEQMFNDIGFELAPGDSKKFDVRLLRNEVTYEPGSYRVVKYYTLFDYGKTKEQHCAYAEFTVE